LNNQVFNNLKKSLTICALVIAGCDLVFLLFGLSSKERFLFLPLLWDLAFLPFWVIAFFSVSLKRKQQLRIENAQLDKKDNALFNESYEQVLLNKQVTAFNKVFTPLCTIISLIIFIIIAYLTFYHKVSFKSFTFPAAAISCLFIFKGLLLYNISKYLYGYTQETKLSSIGTIAGLGFYQIAFLLCCTIAILGHSTDIKAIPTIASVCIAITAFVYVVEVICRSVLKFYGILNSTFSPQCPSFITIKTKANLGSEAKNMMQYQFGDLFSKNSKFQSQFVKLICFLFAILFISSTIKKVDPGHIGFVEYLGKPNKKVESGFYLIPPWPFGKLQLVDSQKIQRISSGNPTLNTPVIWKESHSENENFFLVHISNDSKNLPIADYAVNYTFSYKIKDAYKYLYTHKEPKRVLKKILEKCISFNLITNKTPHIFDHNKSRLENEMRDEIQSLIERHELGVQIVDFSIIEMHPPKDTVEAFEATVSARIDREDLRLKALTYKKVIEEQISAIKTIKINQANTRSSEIKNKYLGEQKYFTYVLPIYQSLGKHFLMIKTLDMFSDALRHMKKILVFSKHDKKVTNINLEQPLDPDILKLSLEATE
jgi:regulator of protease activity HflC (stomatin/prohibitin superfamily)